MVAATETYDGGQEESSGISELDAMRHSLAHIMAEAVLRLFPDAKLGIGPWIENGFYYDFDLPRTLTPDDLQEVDALMRERIKSASPFQREPISHDEAVKHFKDQPYKLDLIEGFAGQDLSVY